MVYIISTFLLILILITKMFFVFVEKSQSFQPLMIFSIILLFFILVIGSFNYFKNCPNQKRKIDKGQKISNLGKVLSIIILVILGSSFFINYFTKVQVWDSVALYDARAKYLLGNINFSQMVDLSKFDPQNSYYYLLYPPFTSIIHYFWYVISIPLEVNSYYSIILMFLGISVYLFTYEKIGKTSAIVLTLLTISNDIIFSSSLSGYTNLPFTLFIVMGVFLLIDYLDDKMLWKLLFGISLITTSQWIRFLEPMWVGILASFFIVNLKVLNNKKLITFTLFFGTLYGLIEYLSWGKFVSSFGSRTEIVNYSSISMIEPIIGIFTGSLYTVLLQFIKYGGLLLLVYILSMLKIDKKLNSKKNILNYQRLLLRLIILFSIVIYFGGLYFVSFQTEWWNKLGDSFVRSSSFLIPISGYLLLSNLLEKK